MWSEPEVASINLTEAMKILLIHLSLDIRFAQWGISVLAQVLLLSRDLARESGLSNDFL